MAQLAERPIAVHRVHPLTLWVAIFATLLLQVSLPVVLPLARLFDLPLLVVIYFSLMRRNKVFGTLLGAGVGLAQDALARGFLGMFGMSKTVVGYVAAWASVKFNLEPIGPRVVLAAFLVLLHGLVYAGLGRMRESPPPFQPLDLLSAVLVNAALALVLFPLLDRLRRPA
ncbi:MAG TPA: rod shape-determining protein MreD [Terriglobia bacterium]|nr:rod shape-determining protein MreD [Terriglobia bacterium]